MHPPALPTAPDPDEGLRVRLTLRALPRHCGNANGRLKAALKCLLRSFGLRCERIEDLPAESAGEKRIAKN